MRKNLIEIIQIVLTTIIFYLMATVSGIIVSAFIFCNFGVMAMRMGLIEREMKHNKRKKISDYLSKTEEIKKDALRGKCFFLDDRKEADIEEKK